jgi:hypothetical protein
LLPSGQLETLVVFLRRLLFRLAWTDFDTLNVAAFSGVASLLDLRVATIQVGGGVTLWG